MFVNKSYLTFVRPVESSNNAVQVNFDLSHVTLVNLNTKRESLTLTYWTTLIWKDVRLTWIPQDFGGLQEITLPKEMIWNPEVVMFNRNDYNGVAEHSMVVVNYNGTTMSRVQHMDTTGCIMRVRRFPYDRQVCYLRFASTSYDKTKVNINSISMGNTNSFHNLNWKVTSFFVEPHNIPSLNDDRFSVAIYNVGLRRNSSYLTKTLVLPSILISSIMCVLFFIEPCKRTYIATGLFIICTLILNQVDLFLSINFGEIPMIISYISFQMVMLTMQIFMSLVVINCINRSENIDHVPQLLKTMLFGKLPYLLCVKRNSYNTSNEVTWSREGVTGSHETIAPSQDDVTGIGGAVGYTSSRDNTEEQRSYAVLKDIRKVLTEQLRLAEHQDTHNLKEMNASDWLYLARIVDKLCYIIFITIIIITTVVIVHS